MSDGGISGGMGRTRVGDAPRQALGDPEAALDPGQHQHARVRGQPAAAAALDGKTLRRSFDRLHDRAAAHVLGAFATDAALTLGHQEVPDVPAEVGAVQAMIQDLGLGGVVLTVDTLHCQKNFRAGPAGG